MSYISIISNTNLNPCDAIDISGTDLSNVVVLFVDARWQLERSNISTNQTIWWPNKKQPDIFDIMKSFLECQEKESGLEIKSLTFEKNLNKNESCVLNKNQTILDYTDFSGKIVRIFEYPDYHESCGSTNKMDSVILDLMEEAEKFSRHKLTICNTWNDCKKKREEGLEPLQVSDSFPFYENWESAMNNLNSPTTNIFSKTDSLDSKYLYFTNVTRVQLNWASFLAVLTVITLFLTGLFACCCGLIVFALVEEDFQKRNEEREWMAVHLRREEHILPPSSPTPSNDRNMETALSKSTLKTESEFGTARSRNSSVSSASSSNEVSTDQTQLSETEPLMPTVPKNQTQQKK
ncbi:unnamed protein product [Caenorhabditis brenneri]